MTIAVMSAMVRPLVEPHLPPAIEPRWFASTQEMHDLAPEAAIGWFDHTDPEEVVRAVRAAERLEWLTSLYAGLDFLPLDLLRDRGVTVTNGAGINALTIAEYAVMGMLVHAKGYDDVVRARDRRDWPSDSPGKIELAGGRVLLIGYGAIGRLIEPRLAAFGMDVTVVRSHATDGALGPDQWRERLGDFDWVVLAIPATPATKGMIGAEEIAAMKPEAVVVNVGRGSVIDQPALVAALEHKRLGGAFLDVTDPEPLPADHPLWGIERAHLSMHLSGLAQTKMFERAAVRFVQNCHRWVAGEPVEPRFDLDRGY